MHEAAKLRPVVIDESLIDLESLLLAREMGYTGVALKACKGQTQSLLMAAAAQKYGMFLCVQDLTCPGASLIHSVGISAHVPGVAAIEANARQYVPAGERAVGGALPRHLQGPRRARATGRHPGAGAGHPERFHFSVKAACSWSSKMWLTPSPATSRNLFAHSIASAFELALMIARPPTTSLASAKGPSVTLMSLPRLLDLGPLRARLAALGGEEHAGLGHLLDELAHRGDFLLARGNARLVSSSWPSRPMCRS